MAKNERPLPHLDRADTKPYWDACKRHELVLQRCGSCRTWIWYPQEVCHVCNSWDIRWEKVAPRGTVFSWVVLRHALHPWFADQLPLPIALVELDDALNVGLTTNIVECPLERIHVGMPVEAVFKKISDDLTMPYFRPVKA